MKTIKKLIANPTVRLFLRALVAAGLAAVTAIHSGGTTIAWHAVIVGAGLAFVEVFTPLNQLVGIFKLLDEAPANHYGYLAVEGNTAHKAAPGGTFSHTGEANASASRVEVSGMSVAPSDPAPPARPRATSGDRKKASSARPASSSGKKKAGAKKKSGGSSAKKRRSR